MNFINYIGMNCPHFGLIPYGVEVTVHGFRGSGLVKVDTHVKSPFYMDSGIANYLKALRCGSAET